MEAIRRLAQTRRLQPRVAVSCEAICASGPARSPPRDRGVPEQAPGRRVVWAAEFFRLPLGGHAAVWDGWGGRRHGVRRLVFVHIRGRRLACSPKASIRRLAKSAWRGRRLLAMTSWP
jgi:hypothetical protein